MFEFTMPKYYSDNRNAPLIVVWYDLLSIPYSLRPKLNYQYYNITLMDVGKGQEFGINDIWYNFKNVIIAIGIFLSSIIVCAIITCLFVKKKNKNRNEYMLKTYNLRTAYHQNIENEILPKIYAQNKSKFRCKTWSMVINCIYCKINIYGSIYIIICLVSF